MLIKAASGELGPYIATLLRELFQGGPYIALSLTEDQLWRMMQVMFARGRETSCVTTAALLDGFHELLMVMPGLILLAIAS